MTLLERQDMIAKQAREARRAREDGRDFQESSSAEVGKYNSLQCN